LKRWRVAQAQKYNPGDFQTMIVLGNSFLQWNFCRSKKVTRVRICWTYDTENKSKNINEK
jgi:hypothetical protein